MKKRKIAAVICEYNPFHGGHEALLRSLRLLEGEDTAIVAIMSGNFTQRGEPAMFPKQIRAQCALHGGADLVLELPFPYSCAGAERFANAGVHIAAALGCVDSLFFGSECGDIASLTALAEKLESPAFASAYEALAERTGCAKKITTVFNHVYGTPDGRLLCEPNNVLGVEYISALMRKNSSIRALTFSRVGMRHDTTHADAGEPISSASVARAGLLRPDEREGVLSKLPKNIALILRQTIADGRFLSADDRWLSYCLMFYRNCSPEQLLLCDGMAGGLGYRILQAAQACDTPATFFAALRSKKHTDAYLRRALIYGVFGITRAKLNAPPAYTQLLAFNERGREVLSVSRKTATIPVFNRPSAINALPWEEQASVRADSVYCALLERPSRPSDEFRYRPYRETAEKLSTSSVGQTIDILEKI